MSNRRERRAKARTDGSVGPDAMLSQPSRDAPMGKTLVDIASERQLLNRSSSTSSPSITTTKINPDGSLMEDPSKEQVELEATPYLDIALYTSTLTLLNYTLTVLVHHQYASEPPSLVALFYSSTIASPTPALLLIIVSILHPRSAHVGVQLLFAVLSIVAGIWLVHASNKDPYLAVMSKAPPLGTLWIWSVVEMRWEWAVCCLAVVAGWSWWNGYGMF
ncbi:hypothetical protein MMC21_002807 [Puttea exsequens]|nr:hypothetical protein [Puttea exsequens]